MRKTILLCGVFTLDVLAGWSHNVPFITSDNGQYAAVFSYEHGVRTISFRTVRVDCVSSIEFLSSYTVKINGRKIKNEFICVKDYLVFRPGTEGRDYIANQFKRKNRVMLELNGKQVATFDANGFTKFWSTT
ncbi:hypothetical protein [Vibrio barjaei]|uniref:hypothetical protein n=1 Tax=Vibrio barjaei TaxID=1676683 RepID=UPI00228372C4|nr:hypothetical protein [Vibrio barjaei]MCY9870360.1 hypothetical protein [Vibrio barjaei]